MNLTWKLSRGFGLFFLMQWLHQQHYSFTLDNGTLHRQNRMTEIEEKRLFIFVGTEKLM